MKLHAVSRFEQADEIATGMDAAQTVAEAETWDAAWSRLDPSLRRAWVEREGAELGMDPDDFGEPDLHLV